MGDGPLIYLELKSGDSVVAALTGVPYWEGSVPGDVVSEGETRLAERRCESCSSRSRRGEYGGGGEATGSNPLYQ